jgi:hypothetical protein
MEKTPKLRTAFRLTPHGKAALERLAHELGVSQTAVIELLLRERLLALGITLPPPPSVRDKEVEQET